MTGVRKLCIAALIILYTLGAVPAFMGAFNQPKLLLGIPSFFVGIVLLAIGMILVVAFLYWYELGKEEQ